MEATAVACGGKKAFACQIRPDLADEPEKALRWLLDALNPDRRTELHAAHLVRAFKVGRKHGCHILKHWVDDASGYERGGVAPRKTPEQELAEEFERVAGELRRLADEAAALKRRSAGRLEAAS